MIFNHFNTTGGHLSGLATKWMEKKETIHCGSTAFLAMFKAVTNFHYKTLLKIRPKLQSFDSKDLKPSKYC